MEFLNNEKIIFLLKSINISYFIRNEKRLQFLQKPPSTTDSDSVDSVEAAIQAAMLKKKEGNVFYYFSKILGRDCEVKKVMWFLKDIEVFEKL